MRVAFMDLLKANSMDSAIFDLEIEGWRDSVHLPREAIAGILHQKESEETPGVRIVGNVFGMFYLNGKPLIPGKTEQERWTALRALKSWPESTSGKPSKPVNLLPSIKVGNPKELLQAAKEVNSVLGSEGVVIKKAGSKYPQPGKSFQGWIKFHKNYVFDGVVLRKNSTKTKGVWTYEYGLLPSPDYVGKPLPPGDTVFAHVGTSGSTSISMKPGDIITIECETFNVVRNEENQITHISAWVPRVLQKNAERAEPDSIQKVISGAKAEGVLQQKVETEEGDIIYKAQDHYVKYT